MEESTTRRRQRIVVPTRQVQGGFDFKFETDPYDVNLHGILSSQEYEDVIRDINQRMKPARANTIDGVLLATGPLLVPLALWGVRHSAQTRKRKRLLTQAIADFNDSHPELLMRWNRTGPESKLTIESRQTEAAPQLVTAGGPGSDGDSSGGGGGRGGWWQLNPNAGAASVSGAMVPVPISQSSFAPSTQNPPHMAEAKMVV